MLSQEDVSSVSQWETQEGVDIDCTPSTTSGICGHTLRHVEAWEHHWNKGAANPANDNSGTTVISYMTKPETRGLALVSNLAKIDVLSLGRELSTCETEEEAEELKLWKKWDVFADHAQDAMESREHRVVFYIHLGLLMDEELHRVVRHSFDDQPVMLNQEAILDIIFSVDEWYSEYFSSVTGTSASLSGGSRGGVSANISADDLDEEESSAKQELNNLWNLRTRLFFLGHVNKWLQDKTRGIDIEELHDLLKYGEEGGCLVDTKTRVLGYDVKTLTLACSSLYRCWTELSFSKGLLQYVELLKARCASLSAVMFSDTDTLNVSDFRTTIVSEGETLYHVNQRFVSKCHETLGNVDRCLVGFRRLLDSLGRLAKVPSLYNAPFGQESLDGTTSSLDLHICFAEWVCEYAKGSRGDFVMKNFRKHIIAELVRPGEYSEYREKNPLGDPNATNIISKLRPNDMDKIRKHITGSTIPTIIQSTSDAVGMVTARSELAIVALAYFCDETSIIRMEWSEWLVRRGGAKASLLLGKTCFPIMIQTVGGYAVWCPWTQYGSRKRKRGSHCKLYSVLRFHEAFHLTCTLVIRHYRDIFEAITNKYQGSSTQTPKSIATQITNVYCQARNVLVHVFGCCGLDKDIHDRIMSDLGDGEWELYKKREFDEKAFLARKKGSTSVRTHAIQKEREVFDKKEFARRTAHYDAVRSVHIPPTMSAPELFPDLYEKTDDAGRDVDKTDVALSVTYTGKKERGEIVRAQFDYAVDNV
jgi:hypothetical protein